ncbi:hypothetical protein D3C74_421940 [compost metagenome]
MFHMPCAKFLNRRVQLGDNGLQPATSACMQVLSHAASYLIQLSIALLCILLPPGGDTFQFFWRYLNQAGCTCPKSHTAARPET